MANARSMCVQTPEYCSSGTVGCTDWWVGTYLQPISPVLSHYTTYPFNTGFLFCISYHGYCLRILFILNRLRQLTMVAWVTRLSMAWVIHSASLRVDICMSSMDSIRWPVIPSVYSIKGVLSTLLGCTLNRPVAGSLVRVSPRSIRVWARSSSLVGISGPECVVIVGLQPLPHSIMSLGH